MEPDKVSITVETGNSGKWESMKKNPDYLLLLVDKYVKVQLKNISFVGFIHTIDPVTHSIIMQVPKETKFQTMLIPGQAVSDLYEISCDGIEPPTRIQLPVESVEENLVRKNKLIKWFTLNLLPVSEKEDKICIQSVNILPPYSCSDIYADNPIIALQIRKIMERLPEAFPPE